MSETETEIPMPHKNRSIQDYVNLITGEDANFWRGASRYQWFQLLQHVWYDAQIELNDIDEFLESNI